MAALTALLTAQGVQKVKKRIGGGGNPLWVFCGLRERAVHVEGSDIANDNNGMRPSYGAAASS